MAPIFEDFDYTIHGESEIQTPHDEFTVATSPIVHELCGSLAFVVKFDGAIIDGDPLTYELATRTFTIYS